MSLLQDALDAAKDVRKLRAENLAQKGRLRDTAQILIAEIGSVGPESAEDAARRAVQHIQEMERENARFRALYEDARRGAHGYTRLYYAYCMLSRAYAIKDAPGLAHNAPKYFKDATWHVNTVRLERRVVRLRRHVAKLLASLRAKKDRIRALEDALSVAREGGS